MEVYKRIVIACSDCPEFDAKHHLCRMVTVTPHDYIFGGENLIIRDPEKIDELCPLIDVD